MLMLGFRISTLIPGSLIVATLPARSVACPTAVHLPVVEYVIGAVNVPGARPESASVAEKFATTAPFVQPSALASGDRVAVMSGTVRSMLSVMLAVAVLPDLSVAVPAIVWFAPSEVMSCALGHVLMPDSVSEQTNLTVTFVLFQPLALAAGVATTAIVGGVVSTAPARLPPVRGIAI